MERVVADAMTVALDAKRTADLASQKMESHEVLCLERWTQSRKLMEEIQKAQSSMVKGVWGIVIAVAGWALVTLYHGLSH